MTRMRNGVSSFGRPGARADSRPSVRLTSPKERRDGMGSKEELPAREKADTQHAFGNINANGDDFVDAPVERFGNRHRSLPDGACAVKCSEKSHRRHIDLRAEIH